jgi:hypothetical protein
MWLVVLAVVVVSLVLGEAWRQRRKYGPPSGRPNLAGAGFLELQGHLQPDRKVEMMQAQAKGQNVADSEQEVAGAGKEPDHREPTTR